VEVCAQCGHELGIGRFCTNCGHPVGAEEPPVPPAGTHGEWRTDTAERPRTAVPAPRTTTTPPPAVTGPPQRSGYPLFADELPDPTPAQQHPQPIGPEPATAVRHRHVDESRRGVAAGPWVPWVAGMAAMLLVAALGLWLLLGDDDDPTATEPVSDPVPTKKASSDPRKPEGRATVSARPRAEPGELARTAQVRAPRSAPPTQDVTGAPVTFAAAHLVDGVPETCWRMPGDGTGESITFSFDKPTELAEVGLVNGYAKTASDSSGSYDWYAGNRRTLQVEWTFDDGTIVTQDLRQTRDMQTVALDDGVVTEQVTVRLLRVSSPGGGTSSRDYTAISEVSLRGPSS